MGKLDTRGLDTEALSDAALRLMRAPGTTAHAIAEASPRMAARLKGHMQAMQDAGVQAVKTDAPWSQGHADFLNSALAHAADQTVWLAAYNDAVGKGAADPVATADARLVETPPPTLDGVALHLPHLNAHFPKTGTETLSSAAQSLYRLGTQAPALSAARLPNAAILKPWLPVSAPCKLPPLPTLPAGRNTHALPAPNAKAVKASLDPAQLVSALTGIPDAIASTPQRLSEHEATDDNAFMQFVAPNKDFEGRSSDMEGLFPISAGNSTASERIQVQLNNAQGAAFQERVSAFGKEILDNFVEEVSIRPNTANGTASFKIRIDGLGMDPATKTMDLLEAKSSATASLTPNQTKGFPLVEEFGGTVVGKAGGDNYPTGTTVSPGTKVRIIRPNDLPDGY